MKIMTEDVMTEDELRAIDPEEFEGIDIEWVGDGDPVIGRVLYDYDQGLSIVDKEDTERCLAGIHGASYRNGCSYETKEEYHRGLSASFRMLRDKYWSGPQFDELTGHGNGGFFGDPTCAFI